MQLPKELLHKVLEYDGRIVYRFGEYMNRISKEDVRYKMLKRIPKPIFVCMDRTIPLVILRDRRYGNISFMLLKKLIHKNNYDDNGRLLHNDIRQQRRIQENDAILFILEKYTTPYDNVYEIRKIFI